MDYHSVKEQAQESGVSPDWAIAQRRTYIQTHIAYYRSLIQAEHESWRGLRSILPIEQRLSIHHIEQHIKKIKRWQWELTKLNPDWDKNGTHINKETIAQAKAYPIGLLLPESPRGYIAKCPFHEDSHPSGYIKGNFLWCFVCQRGWDTIELIMELHGLTFKEAVLNLAGRM